MGYRHFEVVKIVTRNAKIAWAQNFEPVRDNEFNKQISKHGHRKPGT
jgi:hypothetical protein